MNLASLAEQNIAEFGEYDRLLFEGKTYTNVALHDASCRLARALLDLGCREGDKVVLMMANCPEVFVTYPAVWRAGLTVVPVLFLLDARELSYIVENSQAKVIVTSPDVYPKVQEALRGVPDAKVAVVVTGAAPPPPGCISFDHLIATTPPLQQVSTRGGSDIATILYTSGTTGKPKGVVQTHHNLHSNAMNGWRSATTRDKTEIVLLVLPLAHTFGLSTLVSGYLFGNRGILMGWFDPERALSLIERHKVTYMAGVPTMFVMMTMHPNASGYDTSSVRRGMMYVGYGLSEASPSVAGEREGRPRKPGSTGVPLEGVQVKIVDEEARELPRGQIGEICARGENISPGYYENPAATAETFRDGWLFTGDMGYLDEDGYLFIVERKKDLIIRGGLNVYPKDVEDVIYKHPAVLEVAVVGVPDDRMGEEVCAVLVRHPGAELSAAELIAHCQANLAKYKTPKYVEFVDGLPKTGLGKIQKKEVRRLAVAKFERPG
jgi:long-chain acyl-CoA synthetase